MVHEVEKIKYETITETEIVYVEDTAPPPQDTSLDLLPIWVDSFTQPNSVNGVDIIWVIDRSGSMQDEAAQITLGIETMMNALPQTQWRLVMINISSMNSANHQDFPLYPEIHLLMLKQCMLVLVDQEEKKALNHFKHIFKKIPIHKHG